MALTQEQREYIRQNAGKIKQNVHQSDFINPDEYLAKQAHKEDVKQDLSLLSRLGGTVADALSVIPKVGQTISEAGQRGADTLTKIKEGKLNPFAGGFAFTGDIARGISESIGDVVFGAGEAVLPVELEEKVKKGFTELTEPLIGPMEDTQRAWEVIKSEYPQTAETIEGMLNIGMLGLDIAVPPVTKQGVQSVSRGIRAGKELIEEGVEKVAKKVASGVDEVGDTVKGVGEYLTTQITGLTPETVETLIKNPETITKAQADDISRMTLARNVEEALNTRLDELASTGKEYKLIKQSDEVVQLPENALTNFIKDKYKIQVDDAGKLRKTRASYPMEDADLNALQKFIDLYGDTDVLTAEEFLNSRTAISNIAKYDQAKSNASKVVAKDLRKYLDSFGKDQITGLKELDKKFSPEKNALDALKKDLFDREGNLKASAVSQIANISGKGKEVKLERLQKLVPDIKEKARIIKVLENIEDANKITVGTYARGILAGGGLVTGSMPAIIGAIITSPSVIVPLLTKFGKITKNINISNLAKKIKAGQALTIKEKELVQQALQNAAKAIGGTSTVGTRKGITEELAK